VKGNRTNHPKQPGPKPKVVPPAMVKKIVWLATDYGLDFRTIARRFQISESRISKIVRTNVAI
jgi:hypothetical protein